MPNGNEWYVWKGRTDQRGNEHQEELRKLWDLADQIEGDVAAIDKRIAVIETKVAIFAALGSIVGGIITALVQRLFH